MEVKVEEHKQSGDTNKCFISKELYDHLEIDRDKQYKISVGQLNLVCFVESSEDDKKSIYFSDKALNELLIYEQITLNIWRKDNCINLGPVVGMFVTSKYFDKMKKGVFLVDAFDHIQEAASASNSLAYCFCIDDIDWEGKKIKGCTFIKELKTWKHQWLPMPDVIYDRAAYLEVEEKEKAMEIRHAFQADSNVRFINPVGSLGKWPLYKNLSRFAEMKQYLPETILYKEFEDIISMLNKHKFIFFKSSFGSRGEEVLSIELVDGKYRIDFYDSKLKLIFVDTPKEVKEVIEKFIEDKKVLGRKSFIVQQGLHLIKYDGHCMDFRLHIVKNEEGKWEVTNYYAIYSKGNSKITNFCVGGGITNYDRAYDILQDTHKDIVVPTKAELEAFVIKLGKFIEKAFGPHGEIGIDIAIDENGKLWFIEGNAKSDKFRTAGLDDMDCVSPQALAIFKYALYLSKNRK